MYGLYASPMGSIGNRPTEVSLGLIRRFAIQLLAVSQRRKDGDRQPTPP